MYLGIYLDAVLDSNMRPLFNDTAEKTREWLKRHSTDCRIDSVCIGRTMEIVTVAEYLSR